MSFHDVSKMRSNKASPINIFILAESADFSVLELNVKLSLQTAMNHPLVIIIVIIKRNSIYGSSENFIFYLLFTDGLAAPEKSYYLLNPGTFLCSWQASDTCCSEPRANWVSLVHVEAVLSSRSLLSCLSQVLVIEQKNEDGSWPRGSTAPKWVNNVSRSLFFSPFLLCEMKEKGKLLLELKYKVLPCVQ